MLNFNRMNNIQFMIKISFKVMNKRIPVNYIYIFCIPHTPKDILPLGNPPPQAPKLVRRILGNIDIERGCATPAGGNN